MSTPSSTRSPDFSPWGLENGDGYLMPEINLDNPLPGKYTTTVTNILSKHCSEVKNASDEIVQSSISVSKKKLKELITKHNNEIFAFMGRPDKTPHMIGLAETIFRRYGQDIPTTIKGFNNTTNTNILKDLNLDVSMSNLTTEFNEELKKLHIADEEGGLNLFLKQIRWVGNQYKVIGEEVLRLETTLFEILDLLDKLHNRIPVITSLKSNEVLPELIDTFSKYTDSIFKSTKIEENYKELVEAYKKWNVCRQIVAFQHNFKTDNNCPQCIICLTDPISTAIVPCGHTFCNNCVKKQNTTCYVCRGMIRERVKLYFS